MGYSLNASTRLVPLGFTSGDNGVKMKVKLNVLERLTVASLLPEKGSFLNLKLVREAKEILSFSDKEHKEFGLVNLPNGSIQWSKDKEKEITVGDVMAEVVKKALVKLDKDQVLEDRHFSLYEKFVA